MQLLGPSPNFASRFCAVLSCLLCSVPGLKIDSGSKKAPTPLRIGVLSTATINQEGIIHPAAKDPEVAIITAIASRDPLQAKEYKQSLGEGLKFATVYESYQDLLDNANIEAIYNPLPNGLHYEWTMKALKAGKHVLCEKPFASNAEEAREMVDLAKEKGLVLMEAFHWSYHPFRTRMQEIMKSGIIGTIKNISVVFHQGGSSPVTHFAILNGAAGWRATSELAGGAMMDLGSYALDVFRILIGEVPTVTSAKAVRLFSDNDVDAQMSGNVLFVNSGIQGYFDVGFLGPEDFAADIKVTGTRGVLQGSNFNQPHAGNKIVIFDQHGDVVSAEEANSDGLTSYDFQLRAFADHVQMVRDGSKEAWSFINTGDDPVTTMVLLDQAYSMAGLKPRQGPSGIVPL
mmetsp:Transcript_52990/g.113694  ORF Transcript_52990/g.113694 Transcript_52990/m.113694 type:complete len:401 (+) Transcript_52990:67-1269(+)